MGAKEMSLGGEGAAVRGMRTADEEFVDHVADEMRCGSEVLEGEDLSVDGTGAEAGRVSV